jgi:hypothetical protein
MLGLVRAAWAQRLGRNPDCAVLADEKRLGVIQGVWRCGDRMVMRIDAELPDRCVKTNVPADGQWADIRLSWHHPALYLVILLNLVAYFIVAYFVRTSVIVRVGLTQSALNSARRARVLMWVLFLGGVSFCAAAFAAEFPPLFWLGLALVLLAIPVFLWGARIVWADKIEPGYVWIAGVHRDYLAELPEWPR